MEVGNWRHESNDNNGRIHNGFLFLEEEVASADISFIVHMNNAFHMIASMNISSASTEVRTEGNGQLYCPCRI
jgi:hypothetical protein